MILTRAYTSSRAYITSILKNYSTAYFRLWSYFGGNIVGYLWQNVASKKITSHSYSCLELFPSYSTAWYYVTITLWKSILWYYAITDLWKWKLTHLIPFERLKLEFLWQHKDLIVELHELLLVCTRVQVRDALVKGIHKLLVFIAQVLVYRQIHHHSPPYRVVIAKVHALQWIR